nr:MAG TPA: intron associated endonuclease [Caudoviricetes sp.]
MIGIYKITNKINGISYIGQSRDIEKRWASHRARYQYGTEYNKALYRAFRKYGVDNFDFSIIEQCSEEALNDREIYWVSYYDTYYHGYNETPGGDGVLPPHDGESHPRHKLLEKDVIDIRNRYANHEFKEKVWEDYKDRIGSSGFNKIWNGATWTKVHMDVYTPENRAFHTLVGNSHPGHTVGRGRKQLTVEQIIDIRTRLKGGESIDSIYQDYQQFFKYRQTFTNICNYKTYPYIVV